MKESKYMNKTSLIRKIKGKWYFIDECFSEYIGPYSTKYNAKRGMNRYGKYIERMYLEFSKEVK